MAMKTTHLAVLNRCDSNCRLCQTIGCLHSCERDLLSLQQALNQAKEQASTHVHFPFNMLAYQHREIAFRTCRDLSLTPVLRVHPGFGVKNHAALLAEWLMNGGELEAVFDQPWPEDEVEALRNLAMISMERISAILILNRLTPVSQTKSSLPKFIQNRVQILAERHGSENALNCDELHKIMQQEFQADEFKVSRVQQAYWPDALSDVRGLEPELRFSTLSAAPQVNLSLIVLVENDRENLINNIRHLQRQNLSPDRFEIVLIDLGSTDGSLERLQTHLQKTPRKMNLRYFSWSSQKDAWFDFSDRARRLSRNFAAQKALSENLVFFDSAIISDEAALEQISIELEQHVAVRISPETLTQKKTNQRPRFDQINRKTDLLPLKRKSEGVGFGTLMSMQRGFTVLAIKKKLFFKCGGFSNELRSLWFQNRHLLWSLEKEQISLVESQTVFYRLFSNCPLQQSLRSEFSPKLIDAEASEAQTFYRITLDPNIYQAYFQWMSPRLSLRNALLYLGEFYSVRTGLLLAQRSKTARSRVMQIVSRVFYGDSSLAKLATWFGLSLGSGQ